MKLKYPPTESSRDLKWATTRVNKPLPILSMNSHDKIWLTSEHSMSCGFANKSRSNESIVQSEHDEYDVLKNLQYVVQDSL